MEFCFNDTAVCSTPIEMLDRGEGASEAHKNILSQKLCDPDPMAVNSISQVIECFHTDAKLHLTAAVKKADMLESFHMVEDISLNVVRGLSELITQTGHMNVDFADVKECLSETRGAVLVGSGVATGDNRAVVAAKRAMSSPLLEDIDIHAAQSILVNVTGNEDMSLGEYDKAISIIYNMADENASFIGGMVYDLEMGDDIRVTVVLTGLSVFNA